MPEFKNELTAPVLAFIRTQAWRVSRDYGAVEFDDLFQEMCLAYAIGAHQAKDREAWIVGVAKRQASLLHEKTMKQKGYVQYFYTNKMVRDILEYVFEYEKWDDPSFPMPESARSAPTKSRKVYDQACKRDVYQSIPDPTDARDLCIDLKLALDRMGEEHQRRIRSAYQFGLMPVNQSNEYKKLMHSITILRDRMNNLHNRKDPDKAYVGTREVLSNSAARFLLETQGGQENVYRRNAHS